MNRIMLVCGLLLLVGGVGCVGPNLGFGPFPSSVFGSSVTAGVAGLVPGVIPGENEFAILVVNTDDANAYDVSVTPAGGSATKREALPCSVANFVATCDVASVLIQLPGVTPAASLTIAPDAACSQQLVFIALTTTEATEEEEATTTVSLTTTPPDSIANCPSLSGNIPGQ